MAKEKFNREKTHVNIGTIGHVDPETLDYLFDMMSDPEAMKNAMRQTDAAMSEISNVPGGEQMLDRVLSVEST